MGIHRVEHYYNTLSPVDLVVARNCAFHFTYLLIRALVDFAPYFRFRFSSVSARKCLPCLSHPPLRTLLNPPLFPSPPVLVPTSIVLVKYCVMLKSVHGIDVSPRISNLPQYSTTPPNPPPPLQ